VPLAAQLGEAAARCAPAASVALLLDEALAVANRSPRRPAEGSSGQLLGQDLVPQKPQKSPGSLEDRARVVDTVVKLGGGVLADVGRLDAVLAAIGEAAHHRALLLVPGGGPFADAVRGVDRHLGLSDDSAHWMAVLAMDQYAHLVASRLQGGEIVAEPGAIGTALAAGLVPVLAPYRWLRQVDPLPHSWDVTSDSIAAWVTGETRARRLVLIKPSGAEGSDLVDAYFKRALPAHVDAVIVAADRSDMLQAALQG
jgi:aspartokinase-like uncharacterized kinase